MFKIFEMDIRTNLLNCIFENLWHCIFGNHSTVPFLTLNIIDKQEAWVSIVLFGFYSIHKVIYSSKFVSEIHNISQIGYCWPLLAPHLICLKSFKTSPNIENVYPGVYFLRLITLTEIDQHLATVWQISVHIASILNIPNLENVYPDCSFIPCLLEHSQHLAKLWQSLIHLKSILNKSQSGECLLSLAQAEADG